MRPTAQRIDDRARIAELYLHRKSSTFIAKALGMTRRTVVEEITRMRRDWTDSAPRNYHLGMIQELQRIDLVESYAFDGWERSLTRKTVETKQAVRTANGQVDRATVRAETGNGDPAFLARLSWCIEQRCRILGLEKPVEVEIRGSFVEIAMALEANQGARILSDDTEASVPFAWPAWKEDSLPDSDDLVAATDDGDDGDDGEATSGVFVQSVENVELDAMEDSWS